MKRILVVIILSIGFININSQCITSEYEFRGYLERNNQNLNVIEGIWSCGGTIKIFQNNELLASDEINKEIQYHIMKYKGIFSDKTIFLGCKTTGNEGYNFTFTPTATDGLFRCEVDFINTPISTMCNAIMTASGIIKLSFKYPNDFMQQKLKESYGIEKYNNLSSEFKFGISGTVDITLIKIYPTGKESNNYSKSSGTGFAIAPNGIIVTNNHVVENAKKIIVRGVNGDFNSSFKAKVLLTNRNNDLALVQIYDSSFYKINNIPYTIKTNSSEVGESIYVLGYPLRATMGEEIKLTNGIISSKSGYQGDITSYQISAPVQPGNSGGPLINSDGNIIGTVNSKYINAENVTYAIKSSYLMNLIELSPLPIKLNQTNVLKGKSLTEQVILVKKFVYIIEIN